MPRVLLLLIASLASAETLRVYSEFAVLSASGEPAGKPREILSPAVIRNGFTSFQVAVRADQGKRWTLHIGQNPENAVQVTLYRRLADRLEPATLPVESQGNAVFWLDLFAARDAQVGRIKLEPQLYIDNDWVIYPMEVRIKAATVPPSLPEETLTEYLCGKRGEPSGPAAHLSRRNSRQDMGLAAGVPKAELLTTAGSKWCESLPGEAYLRLRDFLFRRF